MIITGVSEREHFSDKCEKLITFHYFSSFLFVSRNKTENNFKWNQQKEEKELQREFLTTFDLHELVADTSSWQSSSSSRDALAHLRIDFGKHSPSISIGRDVVYFFYWLVNSFFTTHILTSHSTSFLFLFSLTSRLISLHSLSQRLFLRRSSCRTLITFLLEHFIIFRCVCDFLIGLFVSHVSASSKTARN
jgi:hypothetical protein